VAELMHDFPRFVHFSQCIFSIVWQWNESTFN
jgi:hypothetical protein